MLPVVQKLKGMTTKPVFAGAESGATENFKEETIYEMPPEVFADGVLNIFDAGISIVGGCCGSDAVCMRLISEGIQQRISE
jgi:5-methyltetrahydrofolate--homocysteine methyltransferase